MHPRSSYIDLAGQAQALALPRKRLGFFVHAALLCAAGPAVADPAAPALDPALPTSPEAVEFDAGFLPRGGHSQVDLSRFERGNVVLPGTYRADVIINGALMSNRMDVTFAAVDGQASAQPCYDRDLLIRLGVDLLGIQSKTEQAAARGDIAAKQPLPLPAGSFCVDIATYIPGATAGFDTGEQRFTLTVPQLYMRRNARGYVSPESWDSGVPAAMVGYNFNTYSNTYAGRTTTSNYLRLNAGFNLGPWHLRHTGSLTTGGPDGARYQNSDTYVQRDLPQLQSQLMAGQVYTDGSVIDSVRIRGAVLATDDTMLSPTQTGYAPVVRGVAETTAKVTIRQRGVILDQVTVAPGPFVIDDLNPTGYGGDLEVEIAEADGRRKTLRVPYAATPQLLRAGYSRYSLALGQMNEAGLTVKPYITQGALQRGISNQVTGYGGATFAQGYGGLTLGSAVGTPIGAFSLDMTHARTTLPMGSAQSGRSVQLRYNKNFDSGLNFSLGAYRYSTSGYLSVRDAVSLRQLALEGGDPENFERLRSRLQLTINQSLGDSGGQLYLQGEAQNYWNRRANNVNFTLGYTNQWRLLSYTLSAQRYRDLGMRLTDTQVNFSGSIPLGRAMRAPTFNTTLVHNSNGRGSELVGLNGQLGARSQGTYAVSATHYQQDGVSGNANAQYNAPLATFTGSYSQGGGYRSAAFGVSGGIVVHPGGVTLAQTITDTIGIVHAPDAAGAVVDGGSNNIKVDRRGYAVVPYLQPYRLNTVQLDPANIPVDVELKSASENVAPRRGAVVPIKYETESGRSVLIKADQPNGEPLPFGADVYDAQGKSVGVVGQASRLYVRGIADSGTLTVKWGSTANEQCHIDYNLPAQGKQRQRVADAIRASCTGAETRTGTGTGTGTGTVAPPSTTTWKPSAFETMPLLPATHDQEETNPW
jgi:outer membrane usher protein